MAAATGGSPADDPNEALTSLCTLPQIPSMAPSWKPTVGIPSHIISGKCRLQGTVSPNPKTEPTEYLM